MFKLQTTFSTAQIFRHAGEDEIVNVYLGKYIYHIEIENLNTEHNSEHITQYGKIDKLRKTRVLLFTLSLFTLIIK